MASTINRTSSAVRTWGMRRLRSDVQQPLDHDGIAGRRPDHGLGRARVHRLELLENATQLVGGVLSVEHDPGKARPGDHLGDDIAAEASPQPDLALVCPQRRLESVPIRLRDDVGVHACLPC